MGHSKADKARTHARIVEIAATRLRERGLEGIGVADLMKEAGLTVGGFYKHFASRDDLVAEAVAACFAQARAATGREAEKLAPTLAGVVDWYLTPAHRDRPGSGCAFAALAPDIARADARTRALATADIGATLDRLAALAASADAGAARGQAILTYSALVGALSLARAASDDALSREILATTAAMLKAKAGAGAAPARRAMPAKARRRRPNG
jgi:TetR/AcrR family transcriptional repressor of nem operon